MFYEKIKVLCASRGVSPYKAATDIGLNRSAVAKWKNGSVPNGSTVSKLAQYFKVSVDYLINPNFSGQTGEGEMFKPVSRDREIEDMVKKLLRLDTVSRNVVAKYLSLKDSERDIINTFFSLPNTLPE